MSQETPTIATQAYTTSNVDPWAHAVGSVVNLGESTRRFNASSQQALGQFINQIQQVKPMPESTRRYVQVFIADPNENVPLEQSVLFKGDQKLTDLTDTELFFEVPMAEALKAHNDKRVKWLDKDATKRSGKDVFLDPVKIRDLKMVVVTIAQF